MLIKTNGKLLLIRLVYGISWFLIELTGIAVKPGVLK